MLKQDDFVIDDSNVEARCFPRTHGNGEGYGLIPRDYDQYPVGCYKGSTTFGSLNDELPLIPWNEMPDRIAHLISTKSQLSDIRDTADNGRPFVSLDQNGQGYCWNYSGTACQMLLRAVANMPYVRLSAHANACIIKNFRDQGGWGAAGLDRQMSHGTPSVEFWPEKSMSRQHDNPRTWENAARHKTAEGWIDIDPHPYDRDMTFQEVLTCLLCRIPVIGDFNWWGHSVALMDAVDVYPNRPATDPRRYGVRILNSWTDRWGTRGTGVLQDQRAIPNGATAPRAMVLS